MSGVMLLDYLSRPAAAQKIRAATGAVLRSGRVLTRDLGGKASTKEMTAAVIRAFSKSRDV